MNFKTKAVGLLAGSALALSVASGAMAEDATTGVLVNENPNPTGCALTVDQSLDADFGTFQWNGTAYEPVAAATDGKAQLSLAVTQDFSASHDCAVTVAGNSALTDGTNTIENSAITVTTQSAGTLDATRTLTFTGIGSSSSQTIDLTLVVAASESTGDYSGSITFTAVAGT